jgi:uncharacterized protein
VGRRLQLALAADLLTLPLALALSLALALPLSARDVPYLAGRVNDTAGMLSPAARQRIEGELAALEKQTGAQVAVLTIDSLDGEALEDYSVRVAKTWKLGQQGKDNGVLFLVAKNDRKMRIEVGYGLEPLLTDLQTHVILDEIVRPAFQSGDFAGGIGKGVDAIAAAVRGLGVPKSVKPEDESPRSLPAGPREGFSLVFLLIVGVFSLAALSSRGCQSWFLYAFLAPFYYFLGGATLGLILAGAWLVLFPLLRLLFKGTGFGGFGGGSGWPPFGGWGGGGWSSGGGGFGGGGGGGFSGGGGSFGGGGSSGSW